MAETRSTCPYCGVGCGVVIESQGDTITGVRGDPAHPANRGRLCSKGQALHLTAAPHIAVQVRALQPMRRAARGGPLQAVAWDEALDEVASRFADTIAEHGPDAVGFYLSGQLLTEDYHAFNKLAKGLVGTNNVDTNSRLCMSSAVAGYKASLGADAVPACYEDIELADTLFITGSNMAWAHPVLYRRLEAARAGRPGMRVIVVDPRRTETAAEADLHLQLLPGTDVMLHHAMLHVMLWEGLVDQAFIAAHTSGFEALRDRVREFTPAHAAKVCGLKAEDIVTAARWFAGLDRQAGGMSTGASEAIDVGAPTRRPTLSLWCQGLNQSASGTDKNTSLLNLHLATGQIGRPGAGPLSLTGQPNAMGGREVGGLANLLPGHREVADAAHRAEVAALWGVRDLPATPGLAAVEMFTAAAEGRLKALWIVCTNPAQSLPDQALVRRALERCEFVVVQDAYRTTATVPYADVLLPAATWGEKEGTVTNSERCISRVRAALPPAGSARADWRIAVDVARRLELKLRGRVPERRAPARAAAQGSLFAADSAEALWNEHRESTRGRDLDITGLSYALLEDAPQTWPRAEGQPASTPRLYADHRFATADGRARFTAPAWQGPAERCDAHYPVALTTGRLRDQWHGMSRTGTLGRLFAHGGAPAVEMHPQELARRGWAEGRLVTLKSRRGTLVLPVRGTEAVAPAQAFVAMHWGGEWLPGGGALGVNALMPTARCPQSRQPELKHAAVRVAAAELPWTLSAAAWLPAAEALAAREALRPLLATLPYAALVPLGHEAAPVACGYSAVCDVDESGAAERADAGEAVRGAQVGLMLQAAATQPLPEALCHELAAALGLAGPALLRYADAKTGHRRMVRLAADGSLAGFLMGGDTASAAWMLHWLQERRPAREHARVLLANRPRPPNAAVGGAPRQRCVVCTCNDVDAESIERALQREPALPGPDGERRTLESLQARLRCGTTCGSCLPAVKAIVRRGVSASAAAGAPAEAGPSAEAGPPTATTSHPAGAGVLVA
ncbi:MAG: molybdopterin-dependent oxidoreductase [Rubrivivax sp.]|nr:molybdopterin-dependent oxidoreductase [Rubrivivax sp.]